MVARRELPSKMFSGRPESALHIKNWREASFDAKPGGENKMQVWGSGFRVWVDNRVRSGVCVFDLWCAQSSPYFACGQNMAGNEDIGSDPLDKLMLHLAVNKRWLCLFCAGNTSVNKNWRYFGLAPTAIPAHRLSHAQAFFIQTNVV